MAMPCSHGWIWWRCHIGSPCGLFMLILKRKKRVLIKRRKKYILFLGKIKTYTIHRARRHKLIIQPRSLHRLAPQLTSEIAETMHLANPTTFITTYVSLLAIAGRAKLIPACLSTIPLLKRWQFERWNFLRRTTDLNRSIVETHALLCIFWSCDVWPWDLGIIRWQSAVCLKRKEYTSSSSTFQDGKYQTYSNCKGDMKWRHIAPRQPGLHDFCTVVKPLLRRVRKNRYDCKDCEWNFVGKGENGNF